MTDSTKKSSIFKNKKTIFFIAIPLLLLALVGIYFLWYSNRFDPEEFSSTMKKGDKEYETQNYGQALNYYIEASQIGPKQKESYVKIIEILSDKGRFDEALKIVKGVIVYLPPNEYADLWAILGAKYKDSQDYFKVFECYEQAYSYDPQQKYLAEMIDNSFRAGRFDKVEKYIAKIKSESEYVKTLWDEYNSMLDDKTEVVKVVKTSKKYLEDGYPHLAYQILLKHDAKLINYWEGKYFLGRSLYEMGKYEESIKYFDSAVTLGSDDPVLALYMARAFDQLKDKQSAYNSYDKSVSFAGKDNVEDIVTEYSNILIEDKQFSRVKDLIDKYSEENWSLPLYIYYYWSNEEFEKIPEILSEIDFKSLSSEVNFQVQSIAIEMYLYNDVNFEKANEYIEMMDSSPWKTYYEALLKIEEEKESEAKELLNTAIDSDLEGFVTKKAEKVLSNME